MNFNSRDSFRVYQFSEIIRGRELSPRVLTFILTLNSWPRLLVDIIFVAHCLLTGYPLGISRFGPSRKCPLLVIEKKNFYWQSLFSQNGWIYASYLANIQPSWPHACVVNSASYTNSCFLLVTLAVARDCPLKGNPRQSWIFWIPYSMEMIPDSNLKWDPGFLELYSGFQSPGFRFSFAKTFPDPGSRISQAKILRIAESGFPYKGRKRR